MHVEDVFGDRIQTAAYFLQDDERDIAELIDAVIQDGYEIIFTANQKFLSEIPRGEPEGGDRTSGGQDTELFCRAAP